MVSSICTPYRTLLARLSITPWTWPKQGSRTGRGEHRGASLGNWRLSCEEKEPEGPGVVCRHAFTARRLGMGSSLCLLRSYRVGSSSMLAPLCTTTEYAVAAPSIKTEHTSPTPALLKPWELRSPSKFLQTYYSALLQLSGIIQTTRYLLQASRDRHMGPRTEPHHTPLGNKGPFLTAPQGLLSLGGTTTALFCPNATNRTGLMLADLPPNAKYLET